MFGKINIFEIRMNQFVLYQIQYPNMKKILFFFFIIFLQLTVFSQVPIKVLFIGNSLTDFYDTPNMFKEMAVSAGKDVFVDDRAVSGMSLDEHSFSQETIDKISEQKWDYVILQGGDYNIAFPKNHGAIRGPIMTLRRNILNNNSQTKIIFFLDWAMKDGVTLDGEYYSYSEFQDKIIEGTVKFSDRLGFLISPVGSAWKQVILDHPEIELFAPDKGHPSLNGAFLQACVYYSTIFKESAVGNTYINDLTLEEALYFQTIASKTVLEDLERWNLIQMDEIDTDSDDSITLFPNPVLTSLYIHFGNSVDKASITLYDTSSRTVFSSDEVVSNNEVEINMLPFRDNIYFIKIETLEGKSVHKIIKQN